MPFEKEKDGKRGSKLPKVEVDPTFSDEEKETPDKPAAQEVVVKKTSNASADSGAFSQDDSPLKQKKAARTDPKVPQSSENLKATKGECSYAPPPEDSPTQRKASKSPIRKMAEKAESFFKSVQDAVKNISPTKKKNLTDSMEVEYERPESKAPVKEKLKKPKGKALSKKLSELYEEVDTDSENVDSGVTTLSSLPDSRSTSVDDRSEMEQDPEDSNVKSAKDDSVDDVKKEKK